LPHHWEVWVPQWPGELCWLESKLLVGPPMQDRSNGRDQMKCSPWPSRFGVGHGDNNLTLEKSVTKPPEPTEEAKTHTGL
jgi:hypothetical protein